MAVNTMMYRLNFIQQVQQRFVTYEVANVFYCCPDESRSSHIYQIIRKPQEINKIHIFISKPQRDRPKFSKRDIKCSSVVYMDYAT